jgi:hypothetical protein
MKNVMKMMVMQQQMDQDYRCHMVDKLLEEETNAQREEAWISRLSNATMQQLLSAILVSLTRGSAAPATTTSSTKQQQRRNIRT